LDVIDDLSGKERVDQLQSQFFDEYPAHMHIDIKSEAQGVGLGERLVRRLFDKMRRNVDVTGVHLVCGEENHRARQLYEKRTSRC
jgi:ribosomal protein S18 acetylase RimI-like enzyme